MKKLTLCSLLGLALGASYGHASAARADSVPSESILVPSPAPPSAKELAAARLEPGTCRSSKEAIYQRAMPVIEEMRAAVDAAYQRHLERQRECWEQYRANEEYWRHFMRGEVIHGSGTGDGQGFGSGHGSLGGSHVAPAATSMSGTNAQVEGVDGKNGSTVEFSGLLVFHVDTKDGFKRLGGIAHTDPDAKCNTWWSRSTSVVKRSVILDDLVYSIASDRMKVQSLKHLGTDVADLDMKQQTGRASGPNASRSSPVP